MPLIKGKSPKAFEHNIKAEMHAGKPQAQSLAIAYNIKRHAQRKAKGGEVCMSDGGEVVEPMFSHKDLAHAVMSKLSSGDDGPEQDSFLSADEQTPLPEVGMPDDTDERMHAMEDSSGPEDMANGAEDDSHKGILHSIMNKIHRKHKG
jgi:hypothetical protein